MKLSDETQYATLRDVVLGYLSLRYTCCIVTLKKHHRDTSFKTYFADGFSILTFKEHANILGSKEYTILRICGTELPITKGVTYSLQEIQGMFINLLVKKKLKFKTKPNPVF